MSSVAYARPLFTATESTAAVFPETGAANQHGCEGVQTNHIKRSTCEAFEAPLCEVASK